MYGAILINNEGIASIKPMNIKMYIHRNMSPGQKDFGVSPDLIDESIEYIDPYNII